MKKKGPRISTASEARSLLKYNSITGSLSWKRDGLDSVKAGREIRTKDNNGYFMFKHNGWNYKAHRIAWLIEFGEWPKGEIDHINGIRDDNRLANLRCVTRQQNSRNMKRNARNTSGATGVQWREDIKSWRVGIRYGGKNVFLGYHKSFFDAVCARKSAEIKYGYHANHGRIQ